MKDKQTETLFERILEESIDLILNENETIKEKLELDESDTTSQKVFKVVLIKYKINTIRELDSKKKVKFFEEYNSIMKDKEKRKDSLKLFDEYLKIAKEHEHFNARDILAKYENNEEEKEKELEESSLLEEIEKRF
jgi:hypothetical protein